MTALAGGALIGISATLMLLLHGRIAGITGIASGAIDPETPPRERLWRWLFLGGLLIGALLLLPFLPDRFSIGVERSLLVPAVAGVLVGVGTRLGSGCTSGHGVCGISRGSPRSLIATLTFVVSGVLTATAYRVIAEGL